jgi:hypothetical protein
MRYSSGVCKKTLRDHLNANVLGNPDEVAKISLEEFTGKVSGKV